MDVLGSIFSSIWFSLFFMVGIVITFALTIISLIKVNRIKNDYKRLTESIVDGKDFNDVFNKYIDYVEDVSRETTRIKDRVENVEKNLEKCVQKVGIVRYNAFNTSSSDLCFAIALLDFEDNGVVINGIYSRDNTTTTYAKPIEHGKSKYTLVKEEEEAIEIARHNGYKCFLELK